MVEVADGEKFEPCFSLRLGAMDEFIRCGEFAAKTAWDLINHHGGVADGIVPKFSSNLFFRDESSSHGDDGTPDGLSSHVTQQWWVLDHGSPRLALT